MIKRGLYVEQKREGAWGEKKQITAFGALGGFMFEWERKESQQSHGEERKEEVAATAAAAMARAFPVPLSKVGLRKLH